MFFFKLGCFYGMNWQFFWKVKAIENGHPHPGCQSPPGFLYFCRHWYCVRGGRSKMSPKIPSRFFFDELIRQKCLANYDYRSTWWLHPLEK